MSEKRKFVYPPTGVTHSGLVIDSANGCEIIECEHCGFKHVVPIPTPEELDALHKDKFYLNEKSDYFKEVEEDLELWKDTGKPEDILEADQLTLGGIKSLRSEGVNQVSHSWGHRRRCGAGLCRDGSFSPSFYRRTLLCQTKL